MGRISRKSRKHSKTSKTSKRRAYMGSKKSRKSKKRKSRKSSKRTARLPKFFYSGYTNDAAEYAELVKYMKKWARKYPKILNLLHGKSSVRELISWLRAVNLPRNSITIPDGSRIHQLHSIIKQAETKISPESVAEAVALFVKYDFSLPVYEILFEYHPYNFL